MDKKVLKHPTLIANSLDGDLKCLKELLKGSEPWHSKENIDFILSSMQREIDRIREWCTAEYEKNMPPAEKKLWESVAEWKEKNKDLVEFTDWYNSKETQDLLELMKEFAMKDFEEFKNGFK